jgi:hypothetical protein
MGGMANLILHNLTAHPIESLVVITAALVVILVLVSAWRREYHSPHNTRVRMERARAERDFLAWERARQLQQRDRLEPVDAQVIRHRKEWSDL